MPVFIAGCGRSGTSYLRTLVDAHPQIFIPSESLFITDYLARAPDVPPRVWRFLLAREPQLLCWYEQELPEVPDIGTTLQRVHDIAAAQHGANYWGQKTPRLVRHRQLIENAFANVRWILVYRDPRAVVASMLRSGQHPYAPSVAINRWLRDNRDIVDFVEHDQAPPNVLLVSYEELVAHPESVLDRVFNFLNVNGISLPAAQANARPVFFSRSRFPTNTVRHGMTAIAPRIDAWRESLPVVVREEIERRCAREMRVLGYRGDTPLTVRAPPLSWHLFNLVGWIKQPWIVVRYLWYWPEYPFWVLLRKAVFVSWPRGRRGQS